MAQLELEQRGRALESRLQTVRDVVYTLARKGTDPRFRKGIMDSGNKQLHGLGPVLVGAPVREVLTGEEWKEGVDLGVGVLTEITDSHLVYRNPQGTIRVAVEHVSAIQRINRQDEERVAQLTGGTMKVGEGYSRVTATRYEAFYKEEGWRPRDDGGAGIINGLRVDDGRLYVEYDRDGRVFRAPVDSVSSVAVDRTEDPHGRDDNGNY